MAKRIQQKTFDEAVLENMKELDLSEEDAREDAIQQFTLQGVDLSNINTSKTETKDPVLTSITEMLEKFKQRRNDQQAFAEALVLMESVRCFCHDSVQNRVLVGEQGVFPIYMEMLTSLGEDPAIESVAGAVMDLLDGQPDLVEGKETFEKIIPVLERNSKSNSSLCAQLILLCRHACDRHENNRQAFVETGGLRLVMEILKDIPEHLATDPSSQHSEVEKTMVINICQLVQVLCTDDDVRVQFGHAHEHAKAIVTEYEGIKIFTSLLNASSTSTAMSTQLLNTLAKLAVRNEICQAIADRETLKPLLAHIVENIADKGVVQASLRLLKAMSGNDKVKGEIVSAGGIPVILAAIARHRGSNATICDLGCSCIAGITLRFPKHASAVINEGGAGVLISVLNVHRKDVAVQRSACMAIRNIVCRTKELSSSFLELGAEDLIRDAIKNHPKAQDEAKAALRDLGCSIALQEPWKGENEALNA